MKILKVAGITFKALLASAVSILFVGTVAAVAFQNLSTTGGGTTGGGGGGVVSLNTFTGDIVPAANNAQDIGYPTLSIRNFYSSSTIFGVNETLTGTSTQGPISFQTDGAFVNAMDETITSASPSGQKSGYEFDLNGNAYYSIQALADGAGGLQTTTTYNVFSQSVIPMGNNAFDLGVNGTNAWQNVYVSSTLFATRERVVNEAVVTSTLYIGTSTGKRGQMCVGDQDGTGWTCFTGNNGTMFAYSTSTD